KTYTCEPVWSERQIVVNTGCWKVESHYVPGPVVNKCCQLPGCWKFDPCTCTSFYCPGPVVNYQVQCPGHTECRPVWVPRQELRPLRTCNYVMREHCCPVTYTVCRQVPCTVMHRVPYTTCRMVPEEHVHYETRRNCTLVPEQKVQYIPYTTCRMVRQDHVR